MKRACTILSATALLLGGCGFHPLYGQSDEAAVSKLPDVFVQPIPERSGQELRLALQQRLAGSSDAQPQGYTLTVNLSDSGEAVGIHGDNTSSRNRLVGSAHWILSSVSPAPAVVATGDARTVDGYNTINEQYFASSIASESTQQRIAINLADNITLQLATWFTNHQQPASTPVRRPSGTYLQPGNVPGDSESSPLTGPQLDGLPAAATGRVDTTAH